VHSIKRGFNLAALSLAFLIDTLAMQSSYLTATIAELQVNIFYGFV
jgi:hypothetical protein